MVNVNVKFFVRSILSKSQDLIHQKRLDLFICSFTRSAPWFRPPPDSYRDYLDYLDYRDGGTDALMILDASGPVQNIRSRTLTLPTNVLPNTWR